MNPTRSLFRNNRPAKAARINMAATCASGKKMETCKPNLLQTISGRLSPNKRTAHAQLRMLDSLENSIVKRRLRGASTTAEDISAGEKQVASQKRKDAEILLV